MRWNVSVKDKTKSFLNTCFEQIVILFVEDNTLPSYISLIIKMLLHWKVIMVSKKKRYIFPELNYNGMVLYLLSIFWQLADMSMWNITPVSAKQVNFADRLTKLVFQYTWFNHQYSLKPITRIMVVIRFYFLNGYSKKSSYLRKIEILGEDFVVFHTYYYFIYSLHDRMRSTLD